MSKDISSITALIICFLSSAVCVCVWILDWIFVQDDFFSIIVCSITKGNDDGKCLFVGGTGGRLTAVEVDSDQALDDFRSMMEAFDVQKLAGALGVQPVLLQDLALGEFEDLLSDPPPGLDKLVALSNVLDSAEIGSYNESKRLYDELRSQSVQVTDIIVNQCVDRMLPGTCSRIRIYIIMKC